MSLSLITRGVVIGALALSLSACQALDSLVGGLGDQEVETVDQTAETTDSTVEDAPAETTEAETAEVTPERGPVPSCDAMYSDAQVVAFTEEGRVSEGDISADGYGYGTTNPDLVAVLAGVRNDLRISCTWYLPPEFSSTTSMAILSTEAMAAVEGLLGEVADSQTALGVGSCGSWNRRARTSPANTSPMSRTTSWIPPAPAHLPKRAASCGWVRLTLREALKSSPATPRRYSARSTKPH